MPDVDTVQAAASVPTVAVVEEFRLVGDPQNQRVFYPVGLYTEYCGIVDRYEAASDARRVALEAPKAALEAAQAAYREALASLPEVAEFEQAQSELTGFRRRVNATGISFPHPSKLIPHTQE